MDLKYSDELGEANGQCKTPGWWGRLYLGIGRNDTWVCPKCRTIWRWRYWGYSDMCTWERAGGPVGPPDADDDTSFRLVTAEQAERRCEHGSVSSHGEIGTDWCPGALSPVTEPWRKQMVDQMNLDTTMFTKFAVGGSSGRFAVQHPPLTQTVRERFTPPEDVVFEIRAVPDRLSDFEPVGWYSLWGERWYDVPVYNSVVDDLGFDPLFPVNGGEVGKLSIESRWREVWEDLSR